MALADAATTQAENPTAMENRVLARDLLALVGRLRERLAEDPFANPILSAALAISRRMDRGQLSEAALAGVVAQLRDAAFGDRAARLARYGAGSETVAATIARLVRPDPADSPVPFQEFAGAVARPRLAAVFTAHPTFALAPEAAAALAAGAAPPVGSQRPAATTLAEEFAQAMAAVAHGRDALDALNRALLAAARETWPGRWQGLAPAPLLLASWVGFDTDGRTDIGFLDMLRFRLAMKVAALRRLQAATGVGAATLAAAERQLGAVPERVEPDAVAAFARVLVGGCAVTTAPLLAELDAAIAAAADPMDFLVARAGLAAHGLGLAHVHARLNAAQVHNAIRQRLGLADPPSHPARRRVLLAGISAALEQVEAVPVDFGAILAEQASAPRLMMTLAQILKHIDSETPIRFLIAETETGYTLLAALWLARHYGIERKVEICPLFETASALEGGARIVEEALRSPAWRAYLRAQGRMALQFGYSDSGRYVGQPAASYLIERLKLKIAELLEKYGLGDIELVLFDTHGESVGRGGHPGSLAERLDYLSPPAMRAALAERGIALRTESAFQGGDGYLHFATGERAAATVGGLFAHGFAASTPAPDPIYDDPDFAADFFAASRQAMQELVEDRGYAALLGTFGPSLLDRTGSRPAARQTDGLGGPATIRHPRELRAIPNNAILHQIGWLANSVQGIGGAALRHAETFAEMRRQSPRFRTAMTMVAAALAASDLDVLRAMVATLDPGMWLDRAAQARIPGRREALISVARTLEALDLWAPAQAMFRHIQADHVALRAAWPEAPRMADRLALLHALRIALIQRIFLLAAAIPDFSPRHGITRAGLAQRLVRLDVPASLAFLEEVFPASPDADADRDYGEPHARPEAGSYAEEHATIFRPMAALFGLLREITVAVTHEVGAFG
jgi:phosphoenolpyruvate carboxylase